MERERVQHHGLLQREEEGRGTEDSGVAEEGGMVVETAVRGMCSLNQASPGAKTERNTSLSRGWGGVLERTGSSVSTSTTSYALGKSQRASDAEL